MFFEESVYFFFFFGIGFYVGNLFCCFKICMIIDRLVVDEFDEFFVF